MRSFDNICIGYDMLHIVGQRWDRCKSSCACVYVCVYVCRRARGVIVVYINTNTHTHTMLSITNVKMRNIMAGVFIISSVRNSQSQCSCLLQRLSQILKLSARTHVHHRNSLQNIAVADFQGVDRETTRQRTGRACAAGCRSAIYAHAHVSQ